MPKFVSYGLVGLALVVGAACASVPLFFAGVFAVALVLEIYSAVPYAFSHILHDTAVPSLQLNSYYADSATLHCHWHEGSEGSMRCHTNHDLNFYNFLSLWNSRAMWAGVGLYTILLLSTDFAKRQFRRWGGG